MVMMVIIKMSTTMTGMNKMMIMMTMMMILIVFSVPSMVGGKHQVQGIKARSVELP